MGPEVSLALDPEFGEAEFWMIRRCRAVLGEVTTALEEFRFHEASEKLYHLVWDDFCATYIELAKVGLTQGSSHKKAAILRLLDVLLRALHPFVPFLTEEIHEAVIAARLPLKEPKLLAERDWATLDPLLSIEGGDATLVPRFQEVLSAFRRLKAEQGVDPAKRVPALCSVAALKPFSEALQAMARLDLTFLEGDLSGPTRAVAVVGGGAVALDLAGLKDPAAEKAKLEKEREKLEKELAALQGRLGNERYLEKAPAEEVEKAKALAEEKGARLKAVIQLLG